MTLDSRRALVAFHLAVIVCIASLHIDGAAAQTTSSAPASTLSESAPQARGRPPEASWIVGLEVAGIVAAAAGFAALGAAVLVHSQPPTRCSGVCLDARDDSFIAVAVTASTVATVGIVLLLSALVGRNLMNHQASASLSSSSCVLAF